MSLCALPLASAAFPDVNTPIENAFDAREVMGPRLGHWLQRHGERKGRPEGELLIREGVPDTRLCLLETGTVLVQTSGPKGARATLAELGPGALFGEMAFLENRPPVASVIAGAGCRTLDVDERKLQLAMEADPLLARELFELLGRKLAVQLREQNTILHAWPGVASAPMRRSLLAFACLDEADIAWLARHGQLRSLPDGEALIRQGEAVPELHLLLEGTARVMLRQFGQEAQVGRVEAGESLGEMSLLGDSSLASASVVAEGPLTVLSVEKPLLGSTLAADARMGARFYRAMALLLSRWSRDQLQGRGLAAHSQQAEGEADTNDGTGSTQRAAELLERLRQLAQ